MKTYILILSLVASLSFAADLKTEVSSANSLYQHGKYSEAIQVYKTILGQNSESASIYYNMGDCYFKMGQVGYAVLYFERALKLNPGDDDTKQNLKLAKSRTTDKIDTVPQLFLYHWVDAVISLFSADGWMKLAIYMSFIFGGLIIGFLFLQNIALKRYCIITAVPFFLAFIIALTLTFFRYNTEKQKDYAIVTTPITGVKNSPDDKSKDAFIIHEGLKVKIEDGVDQWCRIRLEDGKIGWILKSQIELI